MVFHKTLTLLACQKSFKMMSVKATYFAEKNGFSLVCNIENILTWNLGKVQNPQQCGLTQQINLCFAYLNWNNCCSKYVAHKHFLFLPWLVVMNLDWFLLHALKYMNAYYWFAVCTQKQFLWHSLANVFMKSHFSIIL